MDKRAADLGAWLEGQPPGQGIGYKARHSSTAWFLYRVEGGWGIPTAMPYWYASDFLAVAWSEGRIEV